MHAMRSTQAKEEVNLESQQVIKLCPSLFKDFGSNRLFRNDSTILPDALSDVEELPLISTLESKIPWEMHDSIDDSDSMSPPDLGITSTKAFKANDSHFGIADDHAMMANISNPTKEVNVKTIGKDEPSPDAIEKYNLKTFCPETLAFDKEFRSLSHHLKIGSLSRRVCDISVPESSFAGLDNDLKFDPEAENNRLSKERMPILISIDDSDDDDDIMFLEEVKKTSSEELDPEKFVDEKMEKIDASFLILPEEAYCEDYVVPGHRKWDTIRTAVECVKRFCLMGCICESLNSIYIPTKHCNHPECMFASNCNYKSRLRSRNAISEKSDKFNSHASHSKYALVEERASMEKEVEFKNEIPNLQQKIDLSDKQIQIEKLPNKIVEQAVIKSELLGKRHNGRIVHKGHFVDSYPLEESMLDELAKNTTASVFIRRLMRKMFTLDFLSSMSVKKIKKKHSSAIIGAAMHRFKKYRCRNGESLDLTEKLVIRVMTSEFNNKNAAKKRKEIQKRIALL